MQTDVAMESYKKNGNEKYEYMALGQRPCDACKAINGQIFDVKKMEIGVNAPPMHPNCMCSTAPYVDEAEYSEWLDWLDKGGFTNDFDMFYKNGAYNNKALYGYDGGDVSAEGQIEAKKVFDDVLGYMPEKVVSALNDGTKVVFGGVKSSQYDATNDILYISKYANRGTVANELGHLVEEKLVNKEELDTIKEDILKHATVENVVTGVYRDDYGNKSTVYLIESDNLLSLYQGRIYVESQKEIVDDNLKLDKLKVKQRMAEIVSEAMMYCFTDE